ncbi:DNA ligase [Candidatus Bathyarchaeota archaeon]|nr:MAG: DNA ligase [Candidatus Bathyarchaeota archaeon]
MKTSFRELAEICEKIESTTKRNLMVSIVSEFLQKLSLEEVEPAVSMILGRAFPKWDQRTLEVSWATLTSVIRKLTDIDWRMFIEAFNRTGDVGDATRIVLEKSRVKKQATLFEKTLTILEVRRNFEAIAEASGSGSREKKERLLEALLSNSSPVEAKYIVKILIGEMRTGFHEGLMELAVSKAFKIPHTLIQKAVMMRGDIGEVAYLAKKGGKDALTNISFRIFHPIKPMLAQMAENVEEALKEHRGKTAFEYKLDGARIQIHKLGDEVRIFSRRLTDVTASLPEIVEIVRKKVKAREAILEGEIIAVNETGNPLPFQHLMRRFRRVHRIEDVSKRIPVKLYLFDLIYFDGQSLIDKPYVERRQKLAEISGKISLTKQIITDNVKDAQLFLEQAINAGHEGLVAKKLDSPYTPGVRGKKWFKIKKTLEPLDLVVVAAEYGYGRRHNWLSDYYLAARDEKTGEFLIVGKTFKGLTDEEIIEMTSRLKELAIKEEGRRVIVVPKIVVEVAYNEIQKSPKYRCGMALRFARITKIREDKSPEEADTIQKIKEIYEKQFEKKAKLV